ncbi:MAG: hypothetical protein JSV32_00355, partial [Dehalococcoidia bacterium]
MKRFIWMLMCTMVLCLAIIVSGCVPKSEYEALQADFEALKADNSSLEALNEQSAQEIEVKDATIQRMQNELDNTKEELSSTKQELDLAETQYKTTLEQLDSYKSEVAMYEEELELYKDTWGSVVASNIQPPYHDIYLTNNITAVNSTLAEVKSFIREDTTDQGDYITDVYMCGHFARDVHNNAEKAGIRAALVALLIEKDDGSTTYHACNAFKTTDEGLIFIDCTGIEAGERGPSKLDKIVSVKLDGRYKPRFLFAPLWRVESMGIIRDIEVY